MSDSTLPRTWRAFWLPHATLVMSAPPTPAPATLLNTNKRAFWLPHVVQTSPKYNTDWDFSHEAQKLRRFIGKAR